VYGQILRKMKYMNFKFTTFSKVKYNQDWKIKPKYLIYLFFFKSPLLYLTITITFVSTFDKQECIYKKPVFCMNYINLITLKYIVTNSALTLNTPQNQLARLSCR